MVTSVTVSLKPGILLQIIMNNSYDNLDLF